MDEPHPHRLLTPGERQRKATDRDTRWRRAEDGSWIMPTLQREYLEDFLLHHKPNRTKSQAVWCKERGISESLTRTWRKDERFVEEWRRELRRRQMSPEFFADVIASMREIATDVSNPTAAVAAGKMLLAMVGAVQPPEVKVKHEVVAKDIAQVSDEELLELVEAERED